MLKFKECDMSEEKELATFITGLALGNEFFEKNEKMTEEQWIPVLHSLITQCDGIINSPGIYSISLQIKQIK